MTGRPGTSWDSFVQAGAVTEVTSRYAIAIDKSHAPELESDYRSAPFDFFDGVVAQPPSERSAGPLGQLEHG